MPQSPGSHLILYDGICGLCNRFNRFVLRRDTPGTFCFAPIQSPIADKILREFGRNAEQMSTFYVVTDYASSSRRLLSKSDAALFVAGQLGGICKLATIFKVIPAACLDVAYDWIARHRYRVFGRYDACPIPSAEHKSRFIGI